MNYVDLHVHTNYSDSTFSPEEAILCAKEKKLAAIAICDHDCTDGIAPCERFAARWGIEVVPGIELTVEKEDVEVHILGYLIDWKQEWFQKRLEEMQSHRSGRIYKMVQKLNENGIVLDPEEVFKLAGKGSVGRLHLARALLKTKALNSMAEIFGTYIGFHKPCYVPNIRFSPKEAITFIRKARGVPVLAHPCTLQRPEIIAELVESGLRGIEVHHTDHSKRTASHFQAIADQYNLIATGGSDCHGMGKGRVLMGGIKVPYTVLERLKEEAKKLNN